MQRGLFIAVGLLGLATVAPASAATPPDTCMDKATTQPEITGCAVKAAQAADRRLNASYHELLRYLDADQKVELETAERAWIRFRDTDCRDFWGSGNFSLAPTNEYYCRADLSNQRANELDGWPPNSPRSAIRPRE